MVYLIEAETDLSKDGHWMDADELAAEFSATQIDALKHGSTITRSGCRFTLLDAMTDAEAGK